ncbi:MAG: alanine racemase [Lawsonibacter sp.]|nr:alanine racemase [Lawsonibacter sp.]
MDINCYNSRLDVNLDTIGHNLEKIQAYTGGLKVLPVVKSNAYGLGTVPIANYLVHECGVRLLAAARIFEACQILDSGCVESEIMILGPVPAYSIPVAVERGIQIPLFLKQDAKRLSEEAAKHELPYVKAHLKIETGMNRIGVKPGQELDDFLQYIKGLGNLIIDGVFTHFATADQANEGAGNDFTRAQFARFRQALDQVKDAGISPRFVHCCNTGATTWLKDAYPFCTHVRVGSLYLGYSSVQNDWNPIGVEESASWKTLIVNLRTIQPGESVGYGRAFMPKAPAKVATIGIGYGDGYVRSFAVSGAPVLIHGTRCKFVGTAMDQSFIDVTGVDCQIGDEVILYGQDGHGHQISGLEIGHLMGETRLAMFTHITQRVARVYHSAKHPNGILLP